jgi:hypothetical protein
MTIGIMIPEPFEVFYQLQEFFNDKAVESSVDIITDISYLFIFMFFHSVCLSVCLSGCLLALLAASVPCIFLRWMTVLLPFHTF